MDPFKSHLKLENQPPEILIKITTLLPFTAGSNLARTSKKMYRTLNRDLYKQSGKHLNWLPLFYGAHVINTGTLERCLEAGAPIDHCYPEDPWFKKFTFSNLDFHPPRLGWRPLRQAISEYSVEAVKWLLAHGADPNETADEVDLMPCRQLPLTLAFRRGHGRLEKSLPARAMIIALYEAGADLSMMEPGEIEEIEHMVSDSTYLSFYWWI
ncbi:hypothetical protein FSARC_4379 [Fusarium sarcochroum]|uniref:F-box domain-containing protein n=1 Tax=Fusarium sarcochroum TaxID=1208366 RepID=A0A8H4U1X5_9HYPO|nr:hypothetical protein FSARC_4379 [Fusarium sarcochroum]